MSRSVIQIKEEGEVMKEEKKEVKPQTPNLLHLVK